MGGPATMTLYIVKAFGASCGFLIFLNDLGTNLGLDQKRMSLLKHGINVGILAENEPEFSCLLPISVDRQNTS